MTIKSDRLSLPCLLAAQFQVALNDNAVKLMLIGLAQLTLTQAQAAQATSLVATLLVAPYVIFAPVSGWLADRFAKSKVLRWGLYFQLLALAVLTASIYVGNFSGAVVGFFLLAIQACAFSPAKYGILKEIVGSERLGVAMGWLEMLTIAAILLGSFVGGKLLDLFTLRFASPWQGAFYTALVMCASALLSLLFFRGVRETEPRSAQPFRTSLLWEHFGQLRSLWEERPLRLSALGVAYFYSLGGMLYLILVQQAQNIHQGVGAATQTGSMLAILGLGIAIGSILVARFCKQKIELGLIPVGGLGIAISLFFAGLFVSSAKFFAVALFGAGLFGAMFTVPLNAYLQDQAADSKRGAVMSATNLMTNLGAVFGIGLQYLLAHVFGFSVSSQLMLLSIPSLVVALFVVSVVPASLLRLVFVVMAGFVYKAKVKGLENIPKGGALLIANHVSYVDAFILQMSCPRPILFLAYDAFHRSIWLGWALKLLGVIPVAPRKAKEALIRAADEIKKGELVCIFPEGQLTRTGTLLKLQKGFEIIARQANAPVIPIYLDRLWGSIFSFSGKRYLWKIPKRWPYHVLLNVGKAIPTEEVSIVRARQALLDLGEQAFQERDELQGNVAFTAIQTLSRHSSREILVDTFPTRQAFSRGTILALALTLASKWRRAIVGARVGIVLPPGIGGLVSNLALGILGKTAVNLNFTAGEAAIQASLDKAGISEIISAADVQAKFKKFPWTKNVIDISSELKSISKFKFLLWRSLVFVFPGSIIALLAGVPRYGDNGEAGLLFTSGSSGMPKGVVLSHRNIIGNVAQFASTGITNRDDTILGCLPLFHSFGFTVTLWYVLLHGVRMVAVPSPLDTNRIGHAIQSEKVTILLGTPTFLRPYLKKLDFDQLKSVRLAITGAEKLPQDLVDGFKEKFQIAVLQGYGLTETSPVASLNLPDPEVVTSTGDFQAGNRVHSVGRLLPGMSARIVDPESGEPMGLADTGLLHLRGPNIFAGYLEEQEKTAAAFVDGWFVTGDIARFDEDGFLFIEGRQSRFSKIGGEMVPHGTLEEKIIEAFGLTQTESQPLVVTSISDATKGEALVVLTTIDISQDQLREKLTGIGLPNLWIPKIIHKIDKIPLLGSGKIDLKECQRIAAGET